MKNDVFTVAAEDLKKLDLEELWVIRGGMKQVQDQEVMQYLCNCIDVCLA